MKGLIRKIQRKLLKLRLQPIRVFCFHQVSEQFNPEVHCKPDWMPLSEFKQKVLNLREAGYDLISLQDALHLLNSNCVRRRKYAVLTCDDGLKCQMELIPWLEEQHIPMTMFVTAKNLDGKSCAPQFVDYFGIKDEKSECQLAQQLYMDKHELLSIHSDIIEIGYHGYKHDDVSLYPIEQMQSSIDMSLSELKDCKNAIPFYAYPFGRYSEQTNVILEKYQLVPVYIDGQKNYNNNTCIHRELL